MDSVRSLQGITGPLFVNERNANRNHGGEAFREALQQQAGEQTEAEPQTPSQTPPQSGAQSGGKRPLGTGLQVRPAVGRKDEDEGRHIDVFA